MTKYLFLISFLIFSTITFAEKDTPRISHIESLLSQSLDSDLFSIKKDKSQPNLIRIELDNSLDEDYKNNLHLWLIDVAKIEPNFKNIFLTRKNEPYFLKSENFIKGSIATLTLLFFLFFTLKYLSRKTNVSIDSNYEEHLTKKIEHKVEIAMKRPSRTIDYL